MMNRVQLPEKSENLCKVKNTLILGSGWASLTLKYRGKILLLNSSIVSKGPKNPHQISLKISSMCKNK